MTAALRPTILRCASGIDYDVSTRDRTQRHISTLHDEIQVTHTRMRRHIARMEADLDELLDYYRDRYTEQGS